MEVEVLVSKENLIFVNNATSILSRKNDLGMFFTKEDWSICSEDNIECIGTCYGVIGVVKSLSGLPPKILVAKHCTLVGTLPTDDPVFRIDSVSFLELSQDGDIVSDLRQCPKHAEVPMSDLRHSSGIGKSAFVSTIGSIRSATSSIKTATVHAAAMASQVRTSGKKDGAAKDTIRLEKRLSDQILKLFNGTRSFYFSPAGDLTRSVLKKQATSTGNGAYAKGDFDDRFFWNKAMLSAADVFAFSNWQSWFLPVIQGYFESAIIPLTAPEDDAQEGLPLIPLPSLSLTLISRRSRYRCGTRYLRRGVDEQGYVANYVETEQILQFSGHVVSFVQVRGSVPIFWSQPGYKYRPPPQLDRGDFETQQAFKNHFDRELEAYSKICIVSLVEKTGKEKIVGDAYEKNVIKYDSPDLTYASFDFHDHCRGLRFENIGLLVEGLEEELKLMRFTWIDGKGTICEQTGTFRVNCMDCLDRTNVVQLAFARRVLHSVLSKLGIVQPEGSIPSNVLMAHQVIWANNGDMISKQYAGTNALKGDYTRTGKRQFAGLMKDGVNSASRFYINRFRDTFRQVAISALTGESIPNELLVSLSAEKTPFTPQDEPDVSVTADRVRQVIEDCRNLLLGDNEVAVGSWGVIDAHPSTGDPTQTDMDMILVITQETLYVIDYDDEDDELERYYPIPFSAIETVEFGPDLQSSLSLNFLRSSAQKSRTQDHTHQLRISYRIGNKSGYLVQCRSTKLRFFNNMAIPIKGEEEMVESLRAICETIVMTLEVHGHPVPVFNGPLVKRKGSVPIANGIPLAANTSTARTGGVLSHLGLPSIGFPRNLSDNQIAAIKDAGSKALISVTHQFSKLSPSSFRRHFHVSKTEPVRCASALSHRPIEVPVLTPSRPGTPDFHEIFADDLLLPDVGIVAIHHRKVSSFVQPPLPPIPTPLRTRSPMLKDTRRATSFCQVGLRTGSQVSTPHRSPDLRGTREPTPEILISSPLQLPKSDLMLPLRDTLGADTGSRTSTPGSAILSALASPLGRLSSNMGVLSPSGINPLTKIAKGVQSLGGNFDLKRSPLILPESLEMRRLKSSCKTRFIDV